MKILIWNECYISGGADWSLIDLLNNWPNKKDEFTVCINETHEGLNLIKKKITSSKILSFNSILEDKLYPSYKNKTYFGVTGTNGKTTTAYLLNSLLGDSSIFVGTIDDDNLFEFTNEKHLTTPKLFNLVNKVSMMSDDLPLPETPVIHIKLPK